MPPPAPHTGYSHRPSPLALPLATATLVAVAGLLALAFAPRRLQFAPQTLSGDAVSIAAVNALGIAQDDFAIGGRRQVILGRILDGEMDAVWQENFAGEVTVARALDVNADGYDEIALMTRDSTGARVLVYDRDGEVLATLGPVNGPPARGHPWEGHLIPMDSLRTGTRPALVCAVAGLWTGPRGISCYDLASSRPVWEFPMGGWPQTATVTDLCGDDHPEVLVATSSTRNGVAANGTDDQHAYAIALNDAGERLWQAQLTGGYGHVQTLALPRRGAQAARVVAAVHSHRGANPERCTLAILDGASGVRLDALSFAHSLGQPRLLDAARGHFVVASMDHFLRVYDPRLELVARLDARAPVEAWACVDVDGNGRNEVIASTEREVLVLDDRLRLRARFPHGGTPGQPIRVLAARAGLRRWRLCTCDARAVAWDVAAVSPWRAPLPLAGVASVSIVSGIAAALLRRPGRGRRLPSMAESHDFLVDYHQIRHEILDEVQVFGALRNWAQQAVDGQSVPLEAFERARDEFLALGAGALRRFAERAAALRVEPTRVDAVRELTQALEQALAATPDAAPGRRRVHAREVAEALRQLADACNTAYREVAERGRCRADMAVHDALLAKQRRLVACGVSPHFATDPGGAAHVLFDPDELRELAGQLIENAATALKQMSGAELHVTVRRDTHDPRWIVVRIADNGPGIPVGLREAVFRPDYSSRAGGGFGLAHARETARRWRGDLVVEDGPDGRGVVLKLLLRVLFPFEEREGERALARSAAGSPAAGDAR